MSILTSQVDIKLIEKRTKWTQRSIKTSKIDIECYRIRSNSWRHFLSIFWLRRLFYLVIVIVMVRKFHFFSKKEGEIPHHYNWWQRLDLSPRLFSKTYWNRVFNIFLLQTLSIEPNQISTTIKTAINSLIILQSINLSKQRLNFSL